MAADDQSEQLYRLLAENTTDLIALYDLEGQRVYASPSCERLLGRLPDDPMGGLHPDDRARAGEEWKQILAGGRSFSTYRHATADGTWLWFEASGCLVTYRGAPHVLAVTRDITERHRADEERAAAEQRFRAFIDNASDGLFLFDAGGTIIEVNQRACDNLGYTRDELIGKSPASFSEVAAARMPEIVKGLVPDKVMTMQSRHRRKDGTTFPVEVRLRSFRDRGMGFGIAIVRDVTDIAQLEEQFRQAQKMEAVGRLAGGIAHDFNNLLMVINSYAELAMDGMTDADPLHDMLDEISKAGERAATLTRQLLAFSRKQVLQPRVVDVNSVVADVTQLLRRLIGETIALRVDLARDIGVVRIDPGQFEQAITNLVVNARDAMPRGGAITIQTRVVEVGDGDRRGMPRGSYVFVGVRDTGEGMEPAVRARVFEPFFTTKGLTRGTGLGLAMVYGFVNQSEGHIEVDSAPGEGAWFKIYLPMVGAAAETPAERDAHVPDGTETVLLVEDEETVREVTRRVLESLGYTVLEAAGGEAAREIAASHVGPIHVLLSDVVMPMMSGRDVATAVTALRPEVRVIFMSGYSQGRSKLDFATAAFLQKPFRVDELARKLREVIDKR